MDSRSVVSRHEQLIVQYPNLRQRSQQLLLLSMTRKASEINMSKKAIGKMTGISMIQINPKVRIVMKIIGKTRMMMKRMVQKQSIK